MNDTTSAPLADTPDPRLRLSALQHSWLAEIGLERRILAHHLSVPSGASVVARPTPVVQRNDSPESTPRTTVSGPDLAMAALKQAGGRRRASPETRLQEEMPSAGEHAESRPPARSQDLPTDWTALQAHAETCQACGLHSQRDQLVFGAGDLQQPDWLIVGEAPAKADDRTGQPFQGKAGKLLHAMLVAAGVHPASVVLGGRPQHTPVWSQPASMYFSNLVKCRPLGNRSPEAPEAAACMPYLIQQIELLQPRRILALGRLAAQALLRVEDDLEDLRGRPHHVTTAAGVQIPVVVTWHPAALLMHPQHKGQAWADLLLARRL